MEKKRIWILTMFDEYFEGFLEYGVLAKALKNERNDGVEFEVNIISIPNYSPKGFKGVDAPVFGGGAGMVMRADVLKNALLKGVVASGDYGENFKSKLHIVYPAPRGNTWSQKRVESFSKEFFSPEPSKDLVFICGRYEGVDERFLENYVDEYISLGDYVLTGGELAVMTILDSALRYAPGVLGNKDSLSEESFANDGLEYPLYTKPQEFEGKLVPEVYLSGHHKNIQEYNKEASIMITKKYRPDLLK